MDCAAPAHDGLLTNKAAWELHFLPECIELEVMIISNKFSSLEVFISDLR